MTGRRALLTMLLTGAATFAVAATAPTRAPTRPASDGWKPDVRPTRRETDCLKGGCHAKRKDVEFVHGPVGVGACDTCHRNADPAKHTFALKHPKTKLCGFCHIGKADGVTVHKPVQQGRCLDCHDPHGGANPEMLRKDRADGGCMSCHDKITRGRRYAHGPVATGSCAACHKSHTSKHPNLLIAEGRRLCLDCHKQMDRQLTDVKNVHKPVAGPCQQCHETHASNHAKHLKQSPRTLCVSCHEHRKIQKRIANAPFKHSPVTDDRGCMNCHAAHGSDLAKLMKGERGAACLNCHDKPIKGPDGTLLAAGVPELARPNMNRHGPIRDGNCGGCHEVHGGRIAHLLTDEYPATFYERFEPDRYALCFNCHTSQLAIARRTDRVTDFRNGRLNLHYVHVTRPRNGRSCRACHSTHASENPMHIAATVRFGSWKLPINFQPTRTGGSCASGCHRKMAYDRVKAVKTRPVVIKPPAALPGPRKGKTP